MSSRLDASGLFHDATFGANAAMSGLVVMLAAAEAYADATRRAANSDVVRANPAKPVVFAAFAAEAWGYAGSRRFAAELADDETANEEEPSSATSSPLPTWMRGASVDASIELGQVGFARRRIPSAETRPKAFAHVNSASGAAGDALVAALRLGADGRDLDVRRATGAPNPDGGGFLLPPSSLFSLVRRTPRVPGVVVAEHDGAFVDPFHGGAFDVGLAAVDVDRMARLAATLAAALPRIAREGGDGATNGATNGGEGDAAEKISRRRRRVPGVRRRGSRRRRTFDGVPDRSIRRFRVRDGEATVDDVRDVSVEVRRGGGGADERSRGAAREKRRREVRVGIPRRRPRDARRDRRDDTKRDTVRHVRGVRRRRRRGVFERHRAARRGRDRGRGRVG